MNTIEKIKAMLSRISALTESDKTDIKAMCKEARIKATFRKNCADCWRDGLILLAVHYNVRKGDDVLTPSGHFVYHNGLKKVVWWWRHNYYELSAQTDDATIERYMAVHPLQTHYSRVEPEPTETVAEETPTEGENGAESGESTDGGTTERPTEENPSTGENAENNEGVTGEGDNGGKEQTDETNE